MGVHSGDRQVLGVERLSNLPLFWRAGFLVFVLTVGIATGVAAQEQRYEAEEFEKEVEDNHQLFPLPYIFYQPETGWGGGVGLLHTYRLAPGARLSTNQLFLVYTLRHQYSGLLQAELSTPGDKFLLAAEFLASHFPDQFYGIGNRTRLADEEDYTLREARIELDLRRVFGGSVQVGILSVYQHAGVREAEAGGMLSNEAIPGAAGGNIAGTGAVIAFDSRDHTLNPQTGIFATGRIRVFDSFVGSDFNFVEYEADARGYTSVAENHVVAAQVLATAQTGTPPFFALAKLGGDNIFRGSFEGRFRDRHRVVLQTEYRFPVWWRLGAVVFGSTGQVAADWRSVNPSNLRYAAGGGLRVQLSRTERVNLRVDVGFTEDEVGVYFMLGEAF